MSLRSWRDWMAFFGDAGIPSAPAKTYAALFVENKIRGDTLTDLNKEYLLYMGFTVTGDIIRILKHAKIVVSKWKEKILLKDDPTGAEKGRSPGPEVVRAKLEKCSSPKIPKTEAEADIKIEGDIKQEPMDGLPSSSAASGSYARADAKVRFLALPIRKSTYKPN